MPPARSRGTASRPAGSGPFHAGGGRTHRPASSAATRRCRSRWRSADRPRRRTPALGSSGRRHPSRSARRSSPPGGRRRRAGDRRSRGVTSGSPRPQGPGHARMIPSLPALEAGLRRPAAGTSRATEAGLDAGRRVLVTGREAAAVVPPEALAVVPADALADDARLAAFLARGAGRVLLDLRERAGGDGVPFDGAGLGRAGDCAAQAWLAAALADARPDDAVLSEEAERDDGRLTADRVWIIDPLDGTREFAERGADGVRRSDFAVHVALWVRGRGLTAGAVAIPARNRVLDTSNVPPVPVPAGPARLRTAVSRTRPPAVAQRLAERGDVELIGLGSVGVKVVAVLDGEADAYVHAGGQYEWDSAAPVAVASAAGLVATRLDGSSLAWNRPDPSQPDLFVCHPAAAQRVRALLDEAGGGGGPPALGPPP